MAHVFNDIMDDNNAWDTILTEFGLSERARQRFTEDFPTARELMLSTQTQTRDVINNQNKQYRNHSTQNQRCYISAMQMTRILAFRKWSIIAVKEGDAMYDVADVAIFNYTWITSIQEEFSHANPDPTSPGPLPVKVPKFNGQNWYEVKAALELSLTLVYGHSGIPLSYLVRTTRQTWDDANTLTSLEQRRIATKAHKSTEFNKDNAELYRILGQEFDTTTLADVIRDVKRSNGIRAWSEVLGNEEGANYRTELRRRAEGIVHTTFYDPNKNFGFEGYFQRHTRYHDMMAKAGAPIQKWEKIEKFMTGIRCQSLQNVYITSTMGNQNLTFTQFYNDIHEKYRRLVDTKQIRPANIHKRKISQVNTDPEGRSSRDGRGNGRRGGRGRGRGRGGRGRGRDNTDISINWSVLPQGLDPHGSLEFDDAVWYKISREAKAEIKKLRALQHQQRNINAVFSGQSAADSAQRSIYSV